MACVGHRRHLVVIQRAASIVVAPRLDGHATQSTALTGSLGAQPRQRIAASGTHVTVTACRHCDARGHEEDVRNPSETGHPSTPCEATPSPPRTSYTRLACAVTQNDAAQRGPEVCRSST